MAYLGYKNKAFREYKKEQEKIRMWKEAEKRKRKELKAWIKEKENKKKKAKEWGHLAMVSILHVAIIALLIIFYAAITLGIAKAETGKIGVGNFVMAVSYTESYDDLQYVANFVNCEQAMKYYNDNCATQGAMIMMCQLEQYMYMPIDHRSDVAFDFEPTDRQSCGFVGVQKPKFTGLE